MPDSQGAVNAFTRPSQRLTGRASKQRESGLALMPVDPCYVCTTTCQEVQPGRRCGRADADNAEALLRCAVPLLVEFDTS